MATTIAEMRAIRRRTSTEAQVALVPTMGALHDGHRSLIRAARQKSETLVVSIFVNPTQFGPQEDFAKYPRNLESDCALLREEHVDVLFAPVAGEMYRAGAESFVDVGPIGERLDGAGRPGHFRGVATVVLKLFHIVTPSVAFFGQKDAAQVAVLQAMVRDLDVPVELVIAATVREVDGLALSSRNRYLSPTERHDALMISRALEQAREKSRDDALSVQTLRGILLGRLSSAGNVRLEYAEIVDPRTLLPVESLHDGALVAVAAFVGTTRLIDNIVLPPQTARGKV